MEPSNLADCAYYLITRLSLSLTGALRKALPRPGIPTSGRLTWASSWPSGMDDGMGNMLGKFGREEGVTLAELGRYAGLEPSSMTASSTAWKRTGW